MVDEGSSASSALELARLYLDRGWSVVPIPPRKKGPVIGNWQRLRLKLEELPARFRKDSNVGVLLGEPSGQLIDVDLDHLLAVELADVYLPPTGAEFGRKSKPRSHRLYSVSSPVETKKWRLPNESRATIVELRSTGCQTVFPGSIHPSGEWIAWERDGEPSAIDADELQQQLEALAAEVCRRLGLSPKQNGSTANGHHPVLRSPAASDVERARRYISKIEPAIQGEGGSDTTFYVACRLVLGFGLSEETALGLLHEYNERCVPPWSEKELLHKVQDAGKQPGERGYLLREAPPVTPPPEANLQLLSANRSENTTVSYATSQPTPDPADILPIFTIGELVEAHPNLHPPVIDGLLRQGETANLIASPKVGKSWMTYGLSLSFACGLTWLDRFECETGRVLIIDNELHPETIAHRIPIVARAMGIPDFDYHDSINVVPLRGHLLDLHGISRLLKRVDRGQYRMILCDAWYRTLPPGTNESDNEAIMQLYNLIDQLAASLEVTWINVHHTSKGQQGSKNVTDVGSGAGSQSRAVDAHIVLREHEEPGCVVLDAAVRSFPPIEPLTLRWNFPLWHPTYDVDPKAVKGRLTKSEERQKDSDRDGQMMIINSLRLEPATMSSLRKNTGLSKERCERLVYQLLRNGDVSSEEITVRGNITNQYRIADVVDETDNVIDQSTT